MRNYDNWLREEVKNKPNEQNRQIKESSRETG